MQLVYIFLFAIQLVAAFVFAGAAMGHKHAFIDAQGALPLTRFGGWVRAFMAAGVAILIAIGLATEKWVADLGVMAATVLFFLEVRRLQGAKGSTRKMAYFLSTLVFLISLSHVLGHFW